MGAVTAKNLRTLQDGRHLIEAGLYLVVRGKSRKYFLRYSINGRRRDLALGDPVTKTLTVVKQEATKCRALIAQGVDPKEERDKEKATKAVHHETFREFFDRSFPVYLAKHRYKKEATDKMYRAIILTYGMPVLQNIAVKDISLTDVRACIDPIWSTIPGQARKLARLLEHLFIMAKVEGIMAGANPAQWRGNLDAFYPEVHSIRPVKHREALTLDELKTAIRRLRETDTSFSLKGILLLIALTASRVNEISEATWDEVDLSSSTLNIRPERRKDGKPMPHRIPLSLQAIRLLDAAREKAGTSHLIFPNSVGKVCDRTYVLQALKKASRPDATLHGLRSIFRDWAAETGVQDVLAEKQLMHAYGSAVVQAYQRSDLLEQRRPVMQAWADEILPMEYLP